MGANAGIADPRADVVKPILKYIKGATTKSVFLDNVVGLMGKRHVPVLKRIVAILRRIKLSNGRASYRIRLKALATRCYGMPGGIHQKRRRLYIVGVRTDVDKGFTWPKEHQP